MRRFLSFLIVIFVATSAAAEVPPLNVPIGEMVEGIACASNPTQTYTLYIPSTFTNERQWPVLLVFDPRGRSLLAAELFREVAETYGWIIVSSDNTRSDGPMEPNTIALQALWPEIHNRMPTDFDRIYTAGFSGGAAVAYSLSAATRKVAGIIACGGRHFPDMLEGNDVPIFASAGDHDFNYLEMHRLDEFLAKQGNPHRLAIFEGTHSWMTPSLAREAVEWLEIVAMQRGLRETDSELANSLLAADMAAAEALVADERELDAARRFREIQQTYDGLADSAAARDRAEKIEASDGFRKQAKAIKRSTGFESRCDEDVRDALSRLRNAEIPPPVTQLARQMRIDELLLRSEQPDAMGLAAQRCLSSLYTGVSFYIPRDTAAEHRYAHAATAYELAVMIREDNPVIWYNLACMRARLNREDAAMEALEHALESGFNRTELLASDEDLDSLRDRNDFKTLLASFPSP